MVCRVKSTELLGCSFLSIIGKRKEALGVIHDLTYTKSPFH